MAFDLAVVTSCAGERFFRFLYHDGALETEDNRKKIRWLEVVRAACDESPIQYILTVIEDDLPRDENDNKVAFQPHEVVRRLHDGGDDGRLFKMAKF